LYPILLVCAGTYLGLAAGPVGLAHASQRWTRVDQVLEDTTTRLRWTIKDNGADIDWNAALAYCTARGAGWRLPSIEELHSLYLETPAKATPVACGESTCRTAPQLVLSASWLWSSTPVGADAYDGVELAWGMSLVNGARTQTVKELSYGSRALCVHDAR
jgi:hypothetical protein